MNDADLEIHSDGEAPLPSDLLMAIERARQTTSSNTMVESLTTRVLALSAVPVTPVSRKRNRKGLLLYGLCAMAASIGVLISFRSWLTIPLEQSRSPTLERLTRPVYSTITTVSLNQIGYRQVEDDLDLADARIEKASEGLALASVRQEIQKALDEYYDWSNER
jgi:hypothetical protein